MALPESSCQPEPNRAWYMREGFQWMDIPWLFLLAALLPAGAAFYEGAWLLNQPTETSRTEAFILNGAARLAKGEGLYPPLAEPPYIVHVYNPLTYLAAGMAGRLFGLGMTGMRFVGRSLSFLAALALSLLLLRWVLRETGSRRAAAVAGIGLFFYHLIALVESYRFRPELPALFLTFAGAAVFTSRWRRRIEGAAVLFFFAFAFKQSFIAAPVAAFLYLLLKRDIRRAARFAAVLSGLLAGFFLLMFALTGRDYFDNAIVSMATNEMMVRHHFGSHYRFVTDALYSLLIATPVAIGILMAERRGGYLLVYLPICLVWAVVSAGKIGADYNYYSESAVLLLVVVAMGLGVGVFRRPAATLLILLVLNFHVYSSILDNGWRGRKIECEVQLVDYRDLIARYRAMPGSKLITEEIIAVHAGDPVGFDWFLLELLEKEGLVDLTPIYRGIEQGEYETIVIARPKTSKAEAIMHRLAEKGPYRQTYADPYVTEYRRLEQARQE
jgi:hypothetical protein